MEKNGTFRIKTAIDGGNFYLYRSKNLMTKDLRAEFGPESYKSDERGIFEINLDE